MSFSKAIRTTIKIAKAIDRANKQAQKERTRQLLQNEKEHLRERTKYLRDKESNEKLAQRLYIQQNKEDEKRNKENERRNKEDEKRNREDEKRNKQAEKEQLAWLKTIEITTFESRCNARKKSKEIIIKSIIR